MADKPYNVEDDPTYNRVTEEMREHLLQLQQEQAEQFSEKRARLISLISSQLEDQTSFKTLLKFVRQYEAKYPAHATRLCDVCGKTGKVHFTEIRDGVKTSRSFCVEHSPPEMRDKMPFGTPHSG